MKVVITTKNSNDTIFTNRSKYGAVLLIEKLYHRKDIISVSFDGVEYDINDERYAC